MVDTLTFVAHQDDDLLFIYPDALQGHDHWVVYLTAGQDIGGLPYANRRADGAKKAHAQAAGVPNNWDMHEVTYAGHPVPIDVLRNTNIKLIFTYILAASAGANDPYGDLFRMWYLSDYAAEPIDKRPAYDRASFLALLRAIIADARPRHILTQDTKAVKTDDHIDHIVGAMFVSEADAHEGKTLVERTEYYGYPITKMPFNLTEEQRNKKVEVFNRYVEDDPLAAGWLTQEGYHVWHQQYPRTVNKVGAPWVRRCDPL